MNEILRGYQLNDSYTTVRRNFQPLFNFADQIFSEKIYTAFYLNFLIAVPYYTVITFKTSWSWLVGLFRARIVVKLIGSNGESDFMQLQRYRNPV